MILRLACIVRCIFCSLIEKSTCPERYAMLKCFNWYHCQFISTFKLPLYMIWLKVPTSTYCLGVLIHSLSPLRTSPFLTMRWGEHGRCRLPSRYSASSCLGVGYTGCVARARPSRTSASSSTKRWRLSNPVLCKRLVCGFCLLETLLPGSLSLAE